MNLTIPASLLITVALLVLLLVPIYLILHVFRFATRHKKSPLNIELLRSPGQTLREEILDLSTDIVGSFLMIPLMGAVLFSMDLTTRHFFPEKYSPIVTYVNIVMGIGVCVYVILKGYGMYKRRNILRLGYDCELAVGQDLNELIKYDFKVYHDFPADGFNIDHIAVGPTGVFAVETKGRSKQLNAEKQNWKLIFDGESLQFPTHFERKPIEQARRQAKWLNKWIESATGEPQQVVPVLALPGWFIERVKPSDLRIYNGKGSHYLAKGKRVLSDKQIQIIAHQVEGKCRDVKSESYKKD